MYQEQPDPVSLAAVHLQMDFNQMLLGTGSGFVIRTKRGPMLVTAKHNLTGREIDGQCKHSQAAVPNFVTLTNFFGRLAERVPLYAGTNDPNNEQPTFLALAREIVDVALLPLPLHTGQHAANSLDDSLWRPESYQGGIQRLHVADTCHVIGYPEGLTNNLGGGRVLPLWKTGHLANDPHFDFNGEKVSLIDATMRPGMSGAPVFVVRDNGVSNEWLEAGEKARMAMSAGGSLPRMTLPTAAPFVRRNRLVGIYAGRTSDTSFIGMVWKPEIIHEVLSSVYPIW
jgi:hypothetical protein